MQDGTAFAEVYFYETNVNPNEDEPRTLRYNDIPYHFESEYPFFDIPDIEHQSYINLSGPKNNLLTNTKTSGIYVFKDGRFNGKYVVSNNQVLANKSYHGSYNNLIVIVNITTNHTSFPADNNKRNLLPQSTNYDELTKFIIDEVHSVLHEKSACKRHTTIAKKLANNMKQLCAATYNHGDYHYDEERYVYDKKNGIRMDAGLLDSNNDVACIFEIKTEPFDDTDIGQIMNYYYGVHDTLITKYGADKIADNTIKLPNISIYCHDHIVPEAVEALKTRFWKNIMKRVYPNATIKVSINVYDAESEQFNPKNVIETIFAKNQNQ